MLDGAVAASGGRAGHRVNGVVVARVEDKRSHKAERERVLSLGAGYLTVTVLLRSVHCCFFPPCQAQLRYNKIGTSPKRVIA